jgi:NAD(P)-dependent dehydrogenase (short-subunit alcohol dehydrogenase family)
MTARFHGKVAIVTGGSRGIGAAVVKRLVTECANVVVNYRSSHEQAHAMVQQMAGAAGKIHLCAGDASTETDVARVVETTVSLFGRIDLVFANAGVSVPVKPMHELITTEWDFVRKSNARSVFLLNRAVIPQMKAQKYRRIVNTASTYSKRSAPLYAAYCASKAAYC